MINVLNIYKIFFYLFITFETTNISKIFSVQALVDSEATGIFINCSFMKKYYMNTHKLPKSILVKDESSGLNLFSFSFPFLFYFHFPFDFLFYFLFLELGLGLE